MIEPIQLNERKLNTMSDFDDSDAPRKPRRTTKRKTDDAQPTETSRPTDSTSRTDSSTDSGPRDRRPRADSPRGSDRPRGNSRSEPRSGRKTGVSQQRDSGERTGSRSGGNRPDANRSGGNRSDGNRSEGNRSEGNRKPYQGRSSGGDRPPRRDSNRTEGYRPVSSGARRNTNEGDGNRSEGNRRPFQRRDSRDGGKNEGYRPVSSGARRNIEVDGRSEVGRHPYQRDRDDRNEGYRPVSSGARRNTGTDERSEGNRRPPRRDGDTRSGPNRSASNRPATRGSGDRRGQRRGDYKEYDPTTAPSKRGARTGWDAVASWYDGWVGKDGSQHHQQLAIPATMELLALKEDEKVLDIGAGQGVLATYVTQVGAEYTGVDVSPRLLDLAKKHHGMYGHFIQADACKLAQSNEIQEASYDAAVFLLSLQDINPLPEALHSAAWALKPGGRIVLLMTHPCFRIPRQSGWGYDENRKLTYRRVDHYMTPLNVPMKSYLGGSGVTISFHRPLHEYVNGLAAAGLVIDQMREITSYKAEENAAESEIPVFMALRARKLSL